MRGRVLVVDDEKNITLVMQAMLEKAGYEVLAYNDSAQALEVIEGEELNAVVTDLYMPGAGGMELLEYAQKHQPDVPVVIITAFGTVESAVAALKRGAFDYITKPFDQVELLSTIRKAVSTHQQRHKEPVTAEAPRAAAAWSRMDEVSGSSSPFASALIGKSAQIQEMHRLIRKIAQSASPALLKGETGTGKELVAHEIHRQSQRSGKPFIRINCAAIPADLLQSELFGHERGAFSGAVTSKPGRYELAHEGTLFIDEVTELPLEHQARLLRAIREGEFERVGGFQALRADVRIIAATQRNLEEEVAAGRFRQDLYYELKVLPLQLVPLKDRSEDVAQLVEHFLARFNQKLGKSVSSISPEALSALMAYSWPGNIRQLENTLERMILMTDEKILSPSELPEEILVASLPKDDTGAGAGSVSFKELVKKQTQNLERDLIEKALEDMSGNVTRTAEKLGLSRKGLQLKIRELGVRRELSQ